MQIVTPCPVKAKANLRVHLCERMKPVVPSSETDGHLCSPIDKSLEFDSSHPQSQPVLIACNVFYVGMSTNQSLSAMLKSELSEPGRPSNAHCGKRCLLSLSGFPPVGWRDETGAWLSSVGADLNTLQSYAWLARASGSEGKEHTRWVLVTAWDQGSSFSRKERRDSEGSSLAFVMCFSMAAIVVSWDDICFHLQFLG